MSVPLQPNPPPLIVALVTQKGGSGKTTLAANLAVAATEAGENVVAYDLDPQASLTAWGKDRAGSNIDDIAVIDGLGLQASDIEELNFIEQNDRPITLVILDCPGVNSTAANLAMQKADFCLLPSRPSPMDIRAAYPTVQSLLTLKRSFAFVINQCTPGRTTSRSNDARGGLEMMGGLALPMIGQRIDYQDAIREGLGVTEYAPASKAAEEMRQLWSWTKAHAVKRSNQETPQNVTQKKIHGGTSGRGHTSLSAYPPVTGKGR